MKPTQKAFIGKKEKKKTKGSAVCDKMKYRYYLPCGNAIKEEDHHEHISITNCDSNNMRLDTYWNILQRLQKDKRQNQFRLCSGLVFRVSGVRLFSPGEIGTCHCNIVISNPISIFDALSTL
jgi:hypothetical protein